MNKNLIHIIAAVAAASLILNIVTIRKVNYLQRDISMRISNLEHGVNGLQGEAGRTIPVITSSIKNLLEEKASSIKEKSHSVLNYNKDSKSSDVKIIVSFKEMDANSKVYIKEEKAGTSDNFLMEAAGGLSYTVNRKYKIGDTVKVSALIVGTTIKEEYLFDFDLKKMLEHRLMSGNGGSSSTAYTPSDKKVQYSRKFVLRNNYDNDNSLRLSKVNATLQANGKVIFNKEIDSYQNEEFKRFIDNGKAVEELAIDFSNATGAMGNSGFTFKEETNLKLIVTATDNLGLTYEYIEEFTLQIDGVVKTKLEEQGKGALGFILK